MFSASLGILLTERVKYTAITRACYELRSLSILHRVTDTGCATIN